MRTLLALILVCSFADAQIISRRGAAGGFGFADANEAGGFTEPVAVAITTTGATNGVLIAITGRVASTDDCSGITVSAGGSGESFTNFHRNDFAGAGMSVEVWYLVNPPTGSLTISAEWASSPSVSAMIVLYYSGVDQTTPLDGAQDDDEFFGDPSVSVTSAVDDLVIFAAILDGSSAFTSGGTQTRRSDLAVASSAVCAVDEEDGDTSVAMSFTSEGFNTTAVGFNINKAE